MIIQATVNAMPVRFSSAVVSVDPDIARRWLLGQVKNRVLSHPQVAKYARDMTSGHWDLNGEAIKFDGAGVLLDGQHRLHAVIKADTTVMMLVCRGVDPLTQKSMDSGRKRTASDALQLRGFKDAALLAATTRLALGAEQRGYHDMARHDVSHDEVIEFLDANPGVFTACEVVRPLLRELDCPGSLLIYSCWMFMAINFDEAVRFFNDAANLVGLAAGDPAIALNKRFSDARRNRERLTHEAYLSLIFRCWNARRVGQPVRLLRINSKNGGLIPVPEPK